MTLNLLKNFSCCNYLLELLGSYVTLTLLAELFVRFYCRSIPVSDSIFIIEVCFRFVFWEFCHAVIFTFRHLPRDTRFCWLILALFGRACRRVFIFLFLLECSLVGHVRIYFSVVSRIYFCNRDVFVINQWSDLSCDKSICFDIWFFDWATCFCDKSKLRWVGIFFCVTLTTAV